MSQELEQLRIGDVVGLLQEQFPDVTASSVRFLEREGLIQPGHSQGGQRRFNDDDVERIRTIKLWQGQNLSLAQIRQRLDARTPDRDLGAVADRVRDDMVDGTVSSVMDTLTGLWQSGTPLLRICDDVICGALHRLPPAWYTDDRLVDRQLEFDERLSAFLATAVADKPVPGNGGVVLSACPTWERHDFAIRMLMTLLEERGIEVHALGPQVSALHLAHAVRRLRPDCVLLSCTTPVSASDLSQYVEEFRSGGPNAPTMYVGGAGIPEGLVLPGAVVVSSSVTITQALGLVTRFLREGRGREGDVGADRSHTPEDG